MNFAQVNKLKEHLITFDRLSLVLLAFLLPLHKAVIPILIALMVLRWLLTGEFVRIPGILQGSRTRVFIALFGLFYIFHLVGMLSTRNLDDGWFDLEVKLTLLIFPLLFITLDPRVLEPSWIRKILLAFVAGAAISLLASLVRAAIAWKASGDPGVFYYTRLSWFHHASYMAMYLNFASVICIYFLIRERVRSEKLHNLIFVVLLFLFMAGVVLLSSKAGIFGMALVLFLSMTYLILRQRMVLRGVIWFILSISVFYLLIHLLPYPMQRLERAADTVGSAGEVKTTTRESTGERLLVWQASLELIGEHFLAGVGTGDVIDELVVIYNEKGITAAARDRLNTHNQFLQTQAALGIIGSLALILMLLLPLLDALRRNYYTYTLFLVIFAFNILFESMLQTQSGVIFYAFFNVLLFSANRQ